MPKNLQRQATEAEEARDRATDKIREARRWARITLQAYMAGEVCWEDVAQARNMVKASRSHWAKIRGRSIRLSGEAFDERVSLGISDEE